MEVVLNDIIRMLDLLPGEKVIYHMKNGLQRLYYTYNVPKIMGYTNEEYEKIKKGDPYLFIVPSDQHLVKSKVQQCIDSTTDIIIVFRLIHKDGGYIWIHVTARLIGELEGAPVIVANIINIDREIHNTGLITEASDRAVVVFDKESREVLYGNREFFRIANVTEDCIGKPCNQVICKMGEWDLENCICLNLNDNKQPFTYNDAITGRSFLITVKEILWGEHQAFVYYMENTTESQKKDREILEKNERLQKVQEESIRAYQRQLDAVMRLNPEAISTFQMNLSQNTCTNGASQYENLLKLQDKGTVDGYFEDAKKFIPEYEYKELKKVMRRGYLLQSFSDGETTLYADCHFHMSDVDERYLRTTISMAENPVSHDIEGILYTLDLTERDLYNHIMQQLFDKQYEGVAVIDVKQRKYSLIQFAYDEELVCKSKMLDYEPGVERLIAKYVPEDEKEEYWSNVTIERIIAQLDEKGIYVFIAHFISKDGSSRIKKISYYYLDQTHNNVLSVTEDITELTKKEQKRVNDLGHALLLAEQATEAKNTFFSNMSHDMRTPLNGVLGFTTLAVEAQTVAEKDEYLNKIKTSGEFLLQLINDVLDLSKLECNKMQLYPETYTLKEIMNGISCAVEEVAKEKGVSLVIDAPYQDSKYIHVDKLRIQQIFVNLLGNAIKFTSSGGHVRMQTKYLNPKIHDANCQVTVIDDGCGMKKDFISHAFDVFSQQQGTAKQNRMGTGLGLAIVKQIVDLMHGTIEMKSEEGKGTQFDVYLPLEFVDEGAPMVRTEAEPIDLYGKRILLCEDHPINRELAVRLLEKKGVQVTTAENGKIGVDIFNQSDIGAFDAILMDIRMPVMDGLEAATSIRKLSRPDAGTIPIIAMTANAFESDHEESRKAGMDAHLSKPINPLDLYRELSTAIRSKHNYL